MIDEDRRLIAGQRRVAACKALGWDTIAVHVVRLKDILRGECDENVVREDFKFSEKNAIAEALEERERLAAKKRKGRPGQPRGAKLAQQAEKGKARAKVAKAVGTGHASLKKIREVCEAAEAEPEKYQSLVDEMDRTGRNIRYRMVSLDR